MRILQIISSANPEGGGPIEVVNQTSDCLIKFGHEVSICTIDDPDSKWIMESKFKIYALRSFKKNKFGFSFSLLSWLKSNAKNFDVVIVNGIWEYMGLAVWLALHRSDIPYFVYPHGMLDPWFKNTYRLKHLKKILYWLLVEYRVLRDARNVLFTCEEEKLLARESFLPYKVNEAVSPLGISAPPKNISNLTDKFINLFPNLRGKRIVLYIGRIHEKKGCDLLINAFAEIIKSNDNLHLLIAGPDQNELASTLKNKVQNLGISNHVTWTGMLQDDQKWGAFHSAEVFCLPSHQENFGIVVIEALASAKPTLISNKINIWRDILNTQAGFVDEDTLDGTLRNFQRWLKLDESEYKQMSVNAQKCFIEKFHIDISIKNLINIFNSKK